MTHATICGEEAAAPKPAGGGGGGLHRLDADSDSRSASTNVLLQLNILQTVVFSDHKGLADARKGGRRRSAAPAKAGGFTRSVQGAIACRVSGLGIRGSEEMIFRVARREFLAPARR